MVQKASAALTDMLQQAIAREIQVSVQYMWQHVMAKGLESAEIADVFEDVAMSEMKHAEKIAERLFYFDVTPTRSRPHQGRREPERNARGGRNG